MKINLTSKGPYLALSRVCALAPKALVIFATILLAACSGNGGSDAPVAAAPAALPIPERVQAKINSGASNVGATISIDGGTPQEMTISNGSATFQADNLDAKDHSVVIKFYQIIGDKHLDLAQSTSTVTVVAGQTTSLAADALSYDTDSFDEDHDGKPNVDDDDNDNDGITDENEIAYGWDPLDDDSDNDGIKDGDEVPALAIATPIPAGVRTKIATTGVIVSAGIVVDGATERDMGIEGSKAKFNVLALLPGDHVVVITFYQRFGSDRIELARNTSNVTVVAGQAAALGDKELTYDTAFDKDNDGKKNIVDSDNDNDGITDVDDPFPLNASETVDTDGDGIGNNTDTDDDNDGVVDTNDAFPLNAAETVDTDGDHIGNNADTDDDNDGLNDADEITRGTNPLLADTDNDGVGDASDQFPLNAAESVDTDADGTGNNADTDDDNDGIADVDEARYGKDPLKDDSDNDGVLDADEVATQISGRGDHTCVVVLSGKIRCWGSNADGELGNGDSSGNLQFLPVFTADIDSAVWVRTSLSHSCAALKDGRIFCWGVNDYGEISSGSVGVDNTTPVEVTTMLGASDIQLGIDINCGILVGNALHCQGNSATVLLQPPPNPIVAFEGNPVSSVGVNNGHSCVVTDSHISCNGNDTFGQLGNGFDLFPPLVPVVVTGIANALTVAVGEKHSCALLQDQDKTVKCWGGNSDSQLGDGGTVDQSEPVSVSGVSNVAEIAVGSFHNCALLQSDGSVVCWGNNTYGQLGNGSRSPSTTPVTVSGITNAISISAGLSHSCAVLANGQVLCWGRNDQGQLGIARPGDLPSSPTPQYVSGF